MQRWHTTRHACTRRQASTNQPAGLFHRVACLRSGCGRRVCFFCADRLAAREGQPDREWSCHSFVSIAAVIFVAEYVNFRFVAAVNRN